MLACVNKRARQDGGGGGGSGGDACVSPVHEKVAAPFLRGGSEGVQIPLYNAAEWFDLWCCSKGWRCLSVSLFVPFFLHESPSFSWRFCLLSPVLPDILKYIGICVIPET